VQTKYFAFPCTFSTTIVVCCSRNTQFHLMALYASLLHVCNRTGNVLSLRVFLLLIVAKYGWCQVNSSAVCCASAPRTSSIIVFRGRQWIALIHIYSEIVARAADPSQSFPRFQFINVLNVHSIRAFSFYLSVKKKFVSTFIERPCNSSFAIKCSFWLILIAATPATQFFRHHKAKLL
jgi:hypothetical protein